MLEIVQRYRAAAPRRVIGLMSGTSVDGVDAVLVEISGQRRETEWRILQHHSTPYPPALQEAILSLSAGQPARLEGDPPPSAQIALLDVWTAEVFAEAALACVRSAGRDVSNIDLVASHGQTVSHLPHDTKLGDISVRATLQLGRGAVIAARTGLPVVADFRAADVALGGQGAPLVPFADWALFAEAEKVRAIQNLGGIGNVTYLPGDRLEDVIAFDTGPANMLVDAAVRALSEGRESYDRDGESARRGRVSSRLMKWLLGRPYYLRKPPKSTGHEEFGNAYFEEMLNEAGRLGVTGENLIATLTYLGPRAAVEAYHAYLPVFPEEIILGGGGSRNPVMVDAFRQLCPKAQIRTHEDFGIPAQAKEGLAFAILANETLCGGASSVPGATGAAAPAILGCLYPPPVINGPYPSRS